MSQPLTLIIDTDPGVDDAIAILMALAWPGLELAGLTTVGGNVPLARATRNALALLEYAGRRDVPVACGAPRPYHGRFGYAYQFHGKSGLSRRLPEPTLQPVSGSAVDFLASKLRESPGQVVIAALGPLTNLAGLLKKYPKALSEAASLFVMGGAVNTDGNVTPHAEFNFYSDPVAAQAVLSSGVPLTLVDLGACRQVYLTKDRVTREMAPGLRANDPLGRLVVQLLTNWFRKHPDREKFEFYDPLALAAALEPGLISTRQMALTVETKLEERIGEVRVLSRDCHRGGNVAVADLVESDAFFALLERYLFRGFPTAFKG